MITIRCAKCKAKLLKYDKVGKGRVLRCWHDRIVHDYTLKNNNLVKCTCGNIIGKMNAHCIKMKQHEIIISGTITKK